MIINMEGKRQSLQKGGASRFSQKSCLSQWRPWKRRPILVVMKNPSKGFLGSLNRADQPIVLCPDQTTISDFLHKTSEIFLLSTKTKKLKNLPTLSAKTRSLENTFFLGDLYAIHSTKTECSPFSILSVFETRSCRESTLTDHPIYFVPRSYEYFTCTYYTSWTFPLCVQIWKILHAHITPFQLSPFPSVLIVHLFMMIQGSSVLTQNMICLRNWHVAKKQIESSWPSLRLTSYRGQNLGWPIQSSLLSRPSCQSGFRPIH